jgi:hypothetical protein
VLGNKPDWIIWTAASLFSSSVDALSRYYPAVGIVILLSLLLAYLLFLAVFLCCFFHLPEFLLIRTIINFFWIRCCHPHWSFPALLLSIFAYFIVVYFLLNQRIYLPRLYFLG